MEYVWSTNSGQNGVTKGTSASITVDKNGGTRNLTVYARNSSGPGGPVTSGNTVVTPKPDPPVQASVSYCKGTTGLAGPINGSPYDSGSNRHDGVQYANIPAGDYIIYSDGAGLSHSNVYRLGTSGSVSITSWQGSGQVTITMTGPANYSFSGNAGSAPNCN